MKIDYNAIQDYYQPQPVPLSKGNDKFFCLTCKKTLDVKQYFKTGRVDKYPSGILPHCKTCVIMGVIDTDPSTFLSILKEIDVPYIPAEWRALLIKKNPGSQSILGKYVSKMRLNQFKKYKWQDTQKLVDDGEASLLAALRQETQSESEAEAKLEQILTYQDISQPQKPVVSSDGTIDMNSMAAMYGLTTETSRFGLTQKEILDLQTTWGIEYSEDQFLALEQLFSDMKQAYILLDPIAISNAKMICKMTVKMNKYLDLDDVDSASKISRQLDLFIKTANLAPVQQKDRQQTTFSIAQAAFLVEHEGGFIPEYYIEKPNDRIDQLLTDMEYYTAALVKGETTLGDMIANAEQILASDNIKEELENYDQFAEFEAEIMQVFDEEEGDDNVSTD